MARKKAAPKGAIPVFSPNRTYNGITAGVQFVDGNGEIPADTPNQANLVDWFQNHGYSIGDVPAAEPAAEDPEDEVAAEPAAE